MLRGFRRSLKEAFSQIFRNKFMNFASVLSITFMLLMLGLFFLLTVNVNMATEGIKHQFDTIEVFLLDDTDGEEAQVIQNSLLSMDEVASVDFIDKDQAMEEFKLRFGSNAYVLDGLATNPLPNSLRVELADVKYGDLVAEICRNFMGVEDVRYYQTEVKKVVKIADVLQKGALIIAAFLIIVSIVVVSNTIKLTVMARELEIRIMKNLGATNWFIRGPLLLQGVIIGILSSAIALGIVEYLYRHFIELYGASISALITMEMVDPQYMIMKLVWIFVALGVSIGAIGSIQSTRKYLKA